MTPAPLVVVRYWAGAKKVAGVAEETVQASTVAIALASAKEGRSPEFARVLDVCSLLVDGQRVAAAAFDEVQLRDGSVIEVLPPFAGG